MSAFIGSLINIGGGGWRGGGGGCRGGFTNRAAAVIELFVLSIFNLKLL